MTEIKLGVAKLIDDAITRRAESKESRNYMGVSGLGEECSRKLWYSFHEPIKITDARVNRIFDLGNMLEDYVIRLLRDAGITVHTHDENGEQFGFTDGDIAGHIDGVLTGLPESTKPHLFECKSANAKNFKVFVDKGYKNNKTYWTQVQVYMLKMGLENCLVVVINKGTCELYFERIKLDKKYAERAILRGKEIARFNADDKPMRKYAKSTFYKCKWCDHATKCWEGEDEETN